MLLLVIFFIFQPHTPKIYYLKEKKTHRHLLSALAASLKYAFSQKVWLTLMYFNFRKPTCYYFKSFV